MEQVSWRGCLALTLAEPLAARSAQPCPNLQLVTITIIKTASEEMMKLKMTLAVAALLTIGLSSAAAYADTVTFTLTNPRRVSSGYGRQRDVRRYRIRSSQQRRRGVFERRQLQRHRSDHPGRQRLLRQLSVVSGAGDQLYRRPVCADGCRPTRRSGPSWARLRCWAEPTATPAMRWARSPLALSLLLSRQAFYC